MKLQGKDVLKNKPLALSFSPEEGVSNNPAVENEKPLSKRGREIRELEEAIRDQREQIKAMEEDCKRMEMAFAQAAERCSPEWYTPEWVGRVRGETRLKSIYYYCS